MTRSFHSHDEKTVDPFTTYVSLRTYVCVSRTKKRSTFSPWYETSNIKGAGENKKGEQEGREIPSDGNDDVKTTAWDSNERSFLRSLLLLLLFILSVRPETRVSQPRGGCGWPWTVSGTRGPMETCTRNNTSRAALENANCRPGFHEFIDANVMIMRRTSLPLLLVSSNKDGRVTDIVVRRRGFSIFSPSCSAVNHSHDSRDKWPG